MPEKSIAIRIDEKLFKKIKIRLADLDVTLKDYIIGLIQKDLSDSMVKEWKSAPANQHVTKESLDEAQKVLDFISGIMGLDNERK